MIERTKMRYVSCPVCGRILMKCQGQCSIEITCAKCNKEIIALVDEERIMVLENKRGTDKGGKNGQVKVSMAKGYPDMKETPMKKAVSY